MIEEIMVQAGFPKDAETLIDVEYGKIINNKEVLKIFELAMDKMFSGEPPISFVDLLKEAAEISGVNRYTSDLIFWLMAAKPLKYIYDVNNMPEDMYIGVLKDIKVKMYECKNLYGIWGMSTAWGYSFYTLKRFVFGRLQFDENIWVNGDYKGILENGDLTFYCHIPSGSPLFKEDVLDSFKKLYEFSKLKLKNGILAIRCVSWLLYPPIIGICKEGSNMRKFYELFDVIDYTPCKNPYHDIWRIFNMNCEGPETIDKLPEDTSFRKAMKQYLKDGGTMGEGLGVVLFDGENIINHNL